MSSAQSPAENKRIVTDQVGRSISLPRSPQRIVSLVPSITELLFDLGLEKEVLGITKFCIHPEVWFRSKQRVGGTKNIHFETIKKINPDLIICNKEENTEAEIKALMTDYPVWVSDISNLREALEMIAQVGLITNREKEARQLNAQIQTAFQELEDIPKKASTTAYLIWKEPWMAAGSDTFIDDMLQRSGFKNIFSDRSRYPEIKPALLRKLNPEYILLSTEPYPFSEIHQKVLREEIPKSRIEVVDGEMFSWYGSRLLRSAGYFRNLIEQLDD